MINYVEKGRGMHEAVYAAGHMLVQKGKETGFAWVSTNDEAVQAIIDGYDPVPFESQEAKVRIVQEINEYFEDIERAYPVTEKKRFSQQEAEYDGWTKDKTWATPTIDAIASARGKDRVSQITNVGAKVGSYRDVVNWAAGDRQRIFDLIEAETDWTKIAGYKFVGP